MTIIGIGLNLLLAALLAAALGLGWRLNRRLKALRDSHDGFALAVRELNTAAQRAEQGLADLRAATDEATDQLGDRIEKGRALANRLERLLQQRPEPAVQPAARDDVLDPAAERRLGALLAAAREARGRVFTPRAPERADLDEPLELREPIVVRTRARPASPEDDLFAEPAPRASLSAIAGGRPVKNIPRILPLVGVAIGGVLAINALAGARDLPGLLSGAQAFAENAVKAVKPGKGKADKAKADAGKADAGKAATGDASDTNATAGPLPAPSIKPQPVCAPTAAELAKEAGLSPAELKVLQSLGERRGQLDARETDLSTQTALMAAAEAKLDAKIAALNGLKSDISGLLTDADTREAAEVDRLVKVFEGMKPKDAAPRMVLLDDSVRIPIAAKMKDRALSAILAQMPAPDAKKLTESLARRFNAAKTLASTADATAAAATAAPDPNAAPAPAKAASARKAGGRKTAARRAAPASKQAAKDAAPADGSAAAPPAPKAG